MVQTRSQQIGDNLDPENIIPLIQPNDITNPARGLALGQHAGVTMPWGAVHSRTHTTTPVDSNYPSKETSFETERELARLRLERELLIEMLKEHIAGTGRQTVKSSQLEGSHICSTKEE